MVCAPKCAPKHRLTQLVLSREPHLDSYFLIGHNGDQCVLDTAPISHIHPLISHFIHLATIFTIAINFLLSLSSWIRTQLLTLINRLQTGPPHYGQTSEHWTEPVPAAVLQARQAGRAGPGGRADLISHFPGTTATPSTHLVWGYVLENKMTKHGVMTHKPKNLTDSIGSTLQELNQLSLLCSYGLCV